MKVLVKEKIADSGVELLRENFEVDLGLEMSDEELAEAIGGYDAILIRSATKLTADLIERASNLKVIGRAGTGVDNVDIAAATRRGIVVANAPESNSVAAAEHTLALALALFRNVPQAHGALVDGRWDRALYKGAELYGKTIGIVGFGRIGQLVAKRAQGFEMDVIAFDKFVSAERFRELGVEGADSLEELYARADVVTVHVPKTPETVNLIDADAIAAMKEGVRIVNCARGELVDLDALVEGLESGKVGGAALDVFPSEPFTEHPVFSRGDVVVTPHLGASTAEAQDRAGIVTAEQVTAALTGAVVTNAVNIAAVRPEEMEALAPFVPLCEKLGRLAEGLAQGSVDRVSVEFRGKLAQYDTRLLGIGVLVGLLAGHTEEPVNLVNAPADGRGTRHRPGRDEGVELRGLHRAGHGVAALRWGRGRDRRHRGRSAQRALPGLGLGRELLPAPRRAHRGLPLCRPAGDDRQGRHGVRRGGGQHRLGRRRRRGGRRARGDGADHGRAGSRRDGRQDPRARRVLSRPLVDLDDHSASSVARVQSTPRSLRPCSAWSQHIVFAP